MSENTGAHVAVELHHVIVTDRQLNKITASCLHVRRILNVYLTKLQGKQQDKMRWKPQKRKDDRCVAHVQCMEDSRRAKQALHWIPGENRN